ncbi:MAG: ArnT family glycosyltransferase [Kiritimatiellia bacterium]
MSRMVILVTALTLFRLWFATTFELAGDEAYYWLWAKNLDWCYFSKGPLVAWTIRCGTALFGDSVLGIRFFAPLLAAATSYAIYFLGRSLYSARIGFWSVVAWNCAPLAVPGSVLMTIDPLSIFFWAAATLAFWIARSSKRVVAWVATGLLVGLGMLGKYTNVALLPSFLIFLLSERKYRRHLRSITFWSMILAAAVCLVPVMVWNYRHAWVTFGHLRHRGALDRQWQFSLASFGLFLRDQLLVYFPPYVIGQWWGVFSRRFRRQNAEAHTYLLTLFLPLVLFYAALALNSPGEANWTAPCAVAGVVLMTARAFESCDRSRTARAAARGTLALAAALSLTLLAAVSLPIPSWFTKNPLRRIRGARNLAEQMAALKDRCGAQFIIAGDYQTASLLSFYLPAKPRVYMPRATEIHSQFALWPGYERELSGSDALFVTKDERPPTVLREDFQSVRRLKKIQSYEKGQPVRQFRLFLCRSLLTGRPSVEEQSPTRDAASGF